MAVGGGRWFWVVLGIRCQWVVVGPCLSLMFKHMVSIDFLTLGLPCRGTWQEDKSDLTHKV